VPLDVDRRAVPVDADLQRAHISTHFADDVARGPLLGGGRIGDSHVGTWPTIAEKVSGGVGRQPPIGIRNDDYMRDHAHSLTTTTPGIRLFLTSFSKYGHADLVVYDDLERLERRCDRR
jgi:hypothetical protein